jgi:hypothetical protein
MNQIAMDDYPAARLKPLALEWLRFQFPDALLTLELGVAKYGEALLDAAAITSDGIYGIEIKGDGDSPARLERQGWIYSRTASQMWLLPAPSLRERCKKHQPRGWGILEPGAGGLACTWHAGNRLHNAPASLLNILWKTELLKVGPRVGVFCKSAWPSDKIAEAIAESAPLSEVRSLVCETLLHRDWSSMKPGGKPVWRPGDALPVFECSPKPTKPTRQFSIVPEATP